MVVEDPNPVIGGGILVEDLPGAVAAAVVDGKDLPGILVFDGPQVVGHFFESATDQRSSLYAGSTIVKEGSRDVGGPLSLMPVPSADLGSASTVLWIPMAPAQIELLVQTTKRCVTMGS